MKLNRHARKRQHKRELKKHHAMNHGFYLPELAEEKYREWAEEPWWYRCSDSLRNEGYTYWRRTYFSGMRKFAKDATNRRIRNHFRTLIANERLEEVMALQGSDYQKEWDYFWNIF